MTPIIIDFEVRSLADLTLVGGRNYAEHSTTEAICCCARTPGSDWAGEWRMGDPTPDWASEPCIAAHNADGFDVHIWRRLGWPEPLTWLDTSAMARSSGLPGKLEEIAELYGAPGSKKDLTGNAITLALSDTKLPPSRKDKATGAPIVAIPDEAKAALREYHADVKTELARLERDGGLFCWPAIPAIVMDAVASYCGQDTDVTRDVVWPLVADFADLEPEVLRVWRASNDRGACFDSDLARQLLASDEAVASEVTGIPIEAINLETFRREMAGEGIRVPQDIQTTWLRRIRDKDLGYPSALATERLRVSELRYHASFVKMARELGAEIDDAQYDTVEPLTRDPRPAVRALANARLALASIASGKLKAGLARVSADGRMRDNVRYFGAHTGRGAGGGLQLQNFPHPDGVGVDGEKVADWDDARVCREIAAPRLWNQAEISMLLRACLHASPGNILIAADFSGVEARANAWAAGDEAAVETFRAGGDSYAKLACQLFGIDRAVFSKKTHFFERDTSKKAELGCGYQMGAPKFKITAEKGGMVWKDPALCRGPECVDPVCGVLERDERGNLFTHGARTIVKAWREIHWPIVDFWYALERASIEAVDGRTSARVDCAIDLSFDMVGPDLAMILPSGRPVVYRRASVADGKYGPQVRFLGPKGVGHLYGGLLCENGIQATCREFLVNGMVNAEEAGLPVLFTVHDEIVSEAPEALAEDALAALSECMTTLPKWADGMPIAVEGFTARRYRK